VGAGAGAGGAALGADGALADGIGAGRAAAASAADHPPQRERGPTIVRRTLVESPVSNHEESFIEAFVMPRFKERCLTFLAGGKKRRRDFVNSLFSAELRPLSCRSFTVTDFHGALASLGSDVRTQPCHLISQSDRLDQTTAILGDFLADDHLFVPMLTDCTVFSLVPGRLAIIYRDGITTVDICRSVESRA